MMGCTYSSIGGNVLFRQHIGSVNYTTLCWSGWITYKMRCAMFDTTVMSMAEGSVCVVQCTTGCRYIHNLEDCNPVLSVLIDDRNGGRKEIVKYSTVS